MRHPRIPRITTLSAISESTDMTTLLLRPDAIREALTAAYGHAAEDRADILTNLIMRLDERGRIGDIARYYLVRSDYRRSTLRTVLAAQHLPIPMWLQSTGQAADANRQFIAATRDTYNAWRKAQRKQRAAVRGNSIRKITHD